MPCRSFAHLREPLFLSFFFFRSGNISHVHVGDLKNGINILISLITFQFPQKSLFLGKMHKFPQKISMQDNISIQDVRPGSVSQSLLDWCHYFSWDLIVDLLLIDIYFFLIDIIGSVLYLVNYYFFSMSSIRDTRGTVFVWLCTVQIHNFTDNWESVRKKKKKKQ